jgi:hypothetical protein
MKLLILSTHPTIHRWRLLPTFLKTIKACLGCEVTVRQVALPSFVVVKDGKIDHAWLESFKAPYVGDATITGLHLSKKQWSALGLEGNARGANPKRKTALQDFYFWSDERTKRKGYWQFVQTLLHELLHEYFQKKGGTDMTHLWHEENPDITKRFPINDLDTIL